MAKDTYIRFRISNIKKDKLQAIADRNGESMTYILEKLIDKYIESNEDKKKYNKGVGSTAYPIFICVRQRSSTFVYHLQNAYLLYLFKIC